MSFLISSITSFTLYSLESIARAPDGHSSIKCSQSSGESIFMKSLSPRNFIPPLTLSSTHILQCIHRFLKYSGRRLNEIPSGFWHHTQDRGQPLKKTVVRMPSPSWVENLRISKIVPFISNISIAGTGDDLILQFIRQFCEICGIPGHPDRKTSVLLWIFLCRY